MFENDSDNFIDREYDTTEENFQRYDVLKINIEYYFIFIITLVLSIIGIIMISSASIAVGERYFNDAFFFVRRQAIWWVVSFIALLLFSKINYRFYMKIATIMMLISIGLLAFVLIPGVAQVIGGGRRWFSLFFFNVQPSEIAKISIILFMGGSLNNRYLPKPVFKNVFWPSFTILLIVTILIFLEPDFGTVVVIWLIVFTMFFIGNVRWPHILSFGAFGLLVLVAYMFMEDYRRQRIFAFLNKTAEASGINFQVNQSLIALGSGNIFGLGLGNSIQKYSYLPAAHTDFIFAIIGEEFGIVGTIVIIALFLAFAFFGIRICRKSKDYYGRVVAGTLTSMIIAQAVINISVVIGLIPVTGITLPFISYGGSSLLTCMIAAGILLNISRQNYELVKKSGLELRDKINEE
jgi:cell division protein FtsW